MDSKGEIQSYTDHPCKIIILGSRCSGKHTLRQLLLDKYQFQKLQFPQIMDYIQESTGRLSPQLSPPESPIKNTISNDHIDFSPPTKIKKFHSLDESPKKFDFTKHGGIPDLLYDNYKEKGVYIMAKPHYSALQHLKQRNFINVIYINAPFQIRFSYAKKKYPEITLEQFSKIDMEFQMNKQIEECMNFVRVNIYNKYTMEDLEKQVESKKQSIIRPFRPNWHEYFMKIADIARRRSNCMKSSVGAVIVNDDFRVVSTGYNGTPRGLLSCFKGGCQRCNSNSNKRLDQCLCLHGQQSAIIEVGIRNTVGCSLYTTLYPCFSCAKVIKQAGIKKIYYMDPYSKQDSGMKFLQQNYNKQDVVQIKIDHVYY